MQVHLLDLMTRVMPLFNSRRFLTEKAQFRFQASPWRTCGGQNGIGTGYAPSILHLLSLVSQPMIYTHIPLPSGAH
jgi:hypothetical protein